MSTCQLLCSNLVVVRMSWRFWERNGDRFMPAFWWQSAWEASLQLHFVTCVHGQSTELKGTSIY